MTCFNPKFAYYEYGPIYKKIKVQSPYQPNNPKAQISIKTGEHHLGKKIQFVKKDEFRNNKDHTKGTIIIPCGKCIGCLLDKSKTWGIRGLLESQQWKNNCFITLTYNNENLPKDKNLHKEDVQNFLKRLRKHYTGIEPRLWKNKIEFPIRYFYSGEYGSENYTMRPHFHLGIFNWRPTDLKFWKTNEYGDNIYISEQVSKIWTNPDTHKKMGFITVEDMNYYTAQYIARYTTKKCFNDHDEIIKAKGLKKEFIETSRKGGLAYQIAENQEEWDKMKRNYGFFIKDKNHKTKIVPIPNYLKNKWKKEDEIQYFETSDKNAKQAQQNIINMLKETGYNIEEYLQIKKRSLIERLKAKKSLRRNRFKTTTTAV